jgi:predicted dinucleotide-utilizing enzyme
MTVTNVPHPENPRTSTLAALSAMEALRRACLRNSDAPPVP